MLLQLVQSSDDHLKGQEVDLAFQAALLGKHRPIVDRDQRVVVALGEHALNALCTPVIDANDLASDDKQTDTVIHLIQFVVLVLQHGEVRLRQAI